ncbi:MAG: serine--tRNA ligase [Candidatus Hydrogenedentota bacterium]
MLDLKFVRDNPEIVREGLAKRQANVNLDGILELDSKRRSVVHEMEQLKAKQNTASEEIARLKKAGKDASEAVEAMKEVSAEVKSLEEQVREAEKELRQQALALPNLPDESAPVGEDESANRIEREWGEIPAFDFEPKDHVDLGEALGIIDLERAAKMARSRFALLRGAGAQLERALASFMLDIHTQEHGYTEVLPPFALNTASMEATGQLPKFAEDLFRLEGHDLWLLPTAEVALANMHRDEVLKDKDLPLRCTAYTPCFRSEAGSYGKDTRGMIRQHQFGKVELFAFTRPEESWDELETLTQAAETILRRLGLPYRVATLCTGDMGFAAAKTYDIEVWLPGQDRYREISSCSNCTDFQARRGGIRFKRGKKPELVHTLNGSGLAVGRTLIALLENYQQADGSVLIPDSLRPYMNGRERITPR